MLWLSLLVATASLGGPTGRQDLARTIAPRRATDRLLAVELMVTRVSGDSGIALVSSGVPLAPGAIRNPRTVRWDLYVEGSLLADTSYAVVPLVGKHRDGSLRAVLVQFRLPLRRADRVRASLSAREDKPLAYHTDPERAIAPDVPAVPEAVALPTSVEYLINSDLVGPTVSVGSSERMGGDWANYERQFRKFADLHWATSAALWSAGNYYDRAAIYYTWWVRTGDVEYWKRATLMAADYRTKYLERNNYGSSLYWAQLEGVALHYLATGDSRSRIAVGRTADVLGAYYRKGALGNTRHRDMESRGQARSLLAFLLAWEVQAPGGRYFGQDEWSRHLPRMLTQILTAQDSSGAFLWGGYCGSSTNYMMGMLNDALVRYHARFFPDGRILPSVRGSSDWLLATQLRPDGSFNYQSVFCERERAGPSPSPDLNLMFVSSLSWLFWMTGETTYRDAADRVFRIGVRRAGLAGTKQFNQNYTTSFHYLAYRTRR